MHDAIDMVCLKDKIDRNPYSRVKVRRKCAPLFILLVKRKYMICFQMRHKKVVRELRKANNRVEQHRPRVVPRDMQVDHQEGRVTVSNWSADGGGYDCSNCMLAFQATSKQEKRSP